MTADEKKQITSMRYSKAGYAEIAAVTGIPVNTVKSYCRRNGLSDAELAKKSFCKCCGCVMSKGKYRPRIFCSDNCRMTWWNQHPDQVNRAATYSFTCACCGRAFTAYGNAHRRYCSRECYLASRRNEEMRE